MVVLHCLTFSLSCLWWFQVVLGFFGCLNCSGFSSCVSSFWLCQVFFKLFEINWVFFSFIVWVVHFVKDVQFQDVRVVSCFPLDVQSASVGLDIQRTSSELIQVVSCLMLWVVLGCAWSFWLFRVDIGSIGQLSCCRLFEAVLGLCLFVLSCVLLFLSFLLAFNLFQVVHICFQLFRFFRCLRLFSIVCVF